MVDCPVSNLVVTDEANIQRPLDNPWLIPVQTLENAMSAAIRLDMEDIQTAIFSVVSHFGEPKDLEQGIDLFLLRARFPTYFETRVILRLFVYICRHPHDLQPKDIKALKHEETLFAHILKGRSAFSKRKAVREEEKWWEDKSKSLDPAQAEVRALIRSRRGVAEEQKRKS